ncbi:MAG: hypothetical protein WCH34_13925 [Bacteroidota bacterium]
MENTNETEKILKVDIESQMKTAYIDNSMSVIDTMPEILASFTSLRMMSLISFISVFLILSAL